MRLTRCPAKSLNKNKEIGYGTLTGNLLAFNEFRSMPIDIDIQHLNSGQGLAETLFFHSTVWHASFFGKVNK